MDLGALMGGANILNTMFANSAQRSIAKTQAATANHIRGLNNKVLAVENERDKVLTGIQRWRQEVYNKRVYENAAKDQETSAVNHFRQKDARARASFAEQIQFAEQEGRMQAQAAASGVTGSVVDMLNLTLQMKKGMEDTTRAQADSQIDYDVGRRQQATWWANMDQLDHSLIFDNQKVADYNLDIAQGPGLFDGIKVSDLKAVAQGIDFSFNKPEADPLGDFIQRGNRGSGD